MSGPARSARPWAFDLDGTLVDTLSASHLRPLAREILERLRAAGIPVVLWSAGGAEYASRVAERVEIAEFVEGFYGKERGDGGRWRLEVLPPEHRPCTCVDDEPQGLPDGVRVIGVSPYLGANPHDRALADVLGAASEEASSLRSLAEPK